MNLAARELECSAVRFLAENRLSLTPESSALLARIKEPVENFAPVIYGLSVLKRELFRKNRIGSLRESACETFWRAQGEIEGFLYANLRVAINCPPCLEAKLIRTSEVLYLASPGENGRIKREMASAGLKGEDRTTHSDDLLIFHLGGLDDPRALADLATTVKPGSTITIYYPRADGSVWPAFFGLTPADPLMDLIASKRAAVARLYEKTHPDYSVQIFGVG